MGEHLKVQLRRVTGEILRYHNIERIVFTPETVELIASAERGRAVTLPTHTLVQGDITEETAAPSPKGGSRLA